MALLNWDSSLSVSIDSIDNQHKKLFDLINDFYDNITKKANRENVLSLVQGMKKYTEMHFSTEEKYMTQFNYANLKEHQKEHYEFIAKVGELEDRIKNGRIVVSVEVTNFLKSWIKNHIQTTDVLYSDFLVKNGVE